MKYAIMSDVHSNPMAFKSAIVDADTNGAEKFIFLGDFVGYGYDPNECINIVKSKFDVVLLGNHEAGICDILPITWFSSNAGKNITRQKDIISEEDKLYMSKLPYRHMEDIGDTKMMFVHGTSTKGMTAFDYIMSTEDAEDAALASGDYGCDITFYGHTHDAVIYKHNNIMYTSGKYISEPYKVKLDKGNKYVVCVGSVGYPRCNMFSCYVLFDSETRELEYRILPFDFDDYFKSMEENKIKIPDWLRYIKNNFLEKIKEKQKYSD